MRLHREAPRKARMEIVPLIDVMFLVLASFVYASSSMTTHRGLKVELPQATTALVERKDHVMITVTATNDVYLDQAPIGMDDLARSLTATVSADPEVQVRINGDGKASHGVVVKVLDTIRRAGVKRVDIESRPAAGGGGS